MRLCYIDGEFKGLYDPVLDLVCVTTMLQGERPKAWWLHNDTDKQAKLREYLTTDMVLVCYSANAESRVLQAMGLNPMDYQWLDLMVGFRAVLNTSLPRASLPSSLVDCCEYYKVPYGFSEEKEEIRDWIVETKEFDAAGKLKAMTYCTADVICMPKLLKGIKADLGKKDKLFMDNAKLTRIWANWSLYSAACGCMEAVGIPLDRDAVVNLTNNYIAARFSTIEKSDTDCYYYDEKTHNYIFKRDVIQLHIALDPELSKVWPKTETGSYSLDKDDLRRLPMDEYLNKWWSVHKILNDLKFFNPDKSTYAKSMGSDSRIRTYFNPFGTITSRNAPPAKSFPFAISRVFRSIVRPPKGMAITGRDWSQNELLIAAILSGDQKMLEAYNSGDAYLAFAKLAGAVPQYGTKETHGAMRDLFKSTVLGTQYGMGERSLRLKLCSDTGRNVTKKTAKDLLAKHKAVFYRYWEWREEKMRKGKRGDLFFVKDGWITETGNRDKLRTYGNWPVQAQGAVVMRKAVILAIKAGLKVMASLHDAIYIVHAEDDTESPKVLKRCMDEAVEYYFPGVIMRSDEKTHYHNEVWLEKGTEKKYEELKIFYTKNPVVDLKNFTGLSAVSLFDGEE